MVEHPDEEQPPRSRELGGERHRPGQTTGDDFGRAPFVDATSSEAFQKEDPEGPDVRLGPDVVVLELFRRHVRRGAESGAVCRENRRVGEQGDAEVTEAGAPVRVQHHVARLDVAVNDPGAVHVHERSGDDPPEPSGTGGSHRPAS